jgi:D-hexose-6-phosphate mutarotase
MSNDPILIKHTASGASATVRPFGATITSFVNSNGKESLFLSSLAKTDGSKATRGGIPLVFPQFGQPNKDMPQHGFLRNNYWKCGDVFDQEEGAGGEFTLALEDVVNARGEGVWKDESTVDCTIVLSVKVNANSLTTVLTIENAGGNTFDYQTLFHTYFKIYGSKALDKDVCNVTGLAGYHIYDQVTKEERVQNEDPVFVDRELDCIFTAPQGKTAIDVVICTGEDGSKVSVHATATVDGEDIPVSAVVWNPFIEKSKGMGDFADAEYHDMICVEPGVLKAGKKLHSGKKVTFLQKITTL